MTARDEEMEQLRREIAELKEAFTALASGAVDTVAVDDVKTHVMLRDAQAELRETATLFRAVFDGALDAMVLADDNGRYVDVNLACVELFGRPREEIIGKRATDFAAPITEPRWSAFQAAGAMIAEYVLQRPDGAQRILEGAAAANILPGIHLAVLRDVTKRRHTEQALAESERRFRALIESSTDAIVLGNETGVITYVSPSMCSMLGGVPEDYLGRRGDAFILAADLPIAARKRAELLASPGATTEATLRAQHRDGTVRWVEFTGRNLLHDTAIGSLVVNLRDITSWLKEEETRSRLAAMVESSHDAIVSVDLDGRIVSWNKAAEHIYGYTAAEAIGMDSARLLSPTRMGEKEILKRVRRGERIQHHETARVRKDGTTVDVSVSQSPIFDSERQIIGTSSIVRDLTGQRSAEAKLRKTEEQLLQSQKMEAIGALAGGVAHDFNNLLSVIMSYAAMIGDELSPNHPLRTDVAEIEQAAERAAALTKQLLAFSRKQLLEPRRLDLNQLVLDMEKMCRRLIGEDIDLVVVPAEELGAVLADKGQIEQVVLNLIVNARDAMPRGGKITIETSNVELDSQHAAEQVGLQAGEYSMLAVSDTGTGMDEETKARIFEPFFTTKEQGKGTGLGLSTVFGIVQQSGGRVTVYSELNIGTTFKVYLPRTERSEQVAPTHTSDVASPIGETILLVEDEDQLRGLFRTILTRAGYQVLDARNGGEAMIVHERTRSSIHLLLTDLVMPGMSGRELAERLTALRPEMRILYMSGYTDDAIVRHGLIAADVSFLQKPVKPDGLLRKVREVLKNEH